MTKVWLAAPAVVMLYASTAMTAEDLVQGTSSCDGSRGDCCGSNNGVILAYADTPDGSDPTGGFSGDHGQGGGIGGGGGGEQSNNWGGWNDPNNGFRSWDSPRNPYNGNNRNGGGSGAGRGAPNNGNPTESSDPKSRGW
jgi:hypothetical protein